MFTSIRKYGVRHGSTEELARRVQEGFLPLLRQMPGFRSYYLLDGGPDVLITISRFDSADEAFASNEKAANWVRNNVLEFTDYSLRVSSPASLVERERSVENVESPRRCGDSVTLRPEMHHFFVLRASEIMAPRRAITTRVP
jgi:heme-degrading monooxygenase HmoA